MNEQPDPPTPYDRDDTFDYALNPPKSSSCPVARGRDCDDPRCANGCVEGVM